MRIIATLLLALLFNTAWAAEEHGGGHGGKSGEEQAGPSVEYILIEPPLIVNLHGPRRYLRADVQMLVEGQENVARIKTHLPALRHTLIMLYGDRDPATLSNVQEREKLRTETLAEVTKTLDQYGSSEGLKDIFFSSFLIQ